MNDLTIDGIPLPPGSARLVNQTLEPIMAATQQRRTVNGRLRDIASAQFRKFRSVITCRDQHAPSLTGVWPGKVVTVDCSAELSHGSGEEPERPVVSSREVDGTTFYRPRLVMMVESYTTDHDDAGAAVGWTLVLEEE